MGSIAPAIPVIRTALRLDRGGHGRASVKASGEPKRRFMADLHGLIPKEELFLELSPARRRSIFKKAIGAANASGSKGRCTRDCGLIPTETSAIAKTAMIDVLKRAKVPTQLLKAGDVSQPAKGPVSTGFPHRNR